MTIEEKRKELCSRIQEVATANNINHIAIADTTGFQPSNVSRMLSGKYSPTLDNLIKLCDAVEIEIQLKDKMADG